MGYIPTPKRFLKHPTLIICAKQNRHLVELDPIAVLHISNMLCNPVCLVPLIEILQQNDRLALRIVCPKRLLQPRIIPLNYRIRTLQNSLRRAVVHLQRDLHRLRIILLKIQDIRNIRPSKRVDTLRIIPHHTQILMRARELLRYHILRMIRVLILINQNISELLLILLQHLRVIPKQVDRLHQQIIKIHRIHLYQLHRIPLIHIRNHPLEGRIPRSQPILCRANQLILRRTNRIPDHPRRKLLRVAFQLLQNKLNLRFRRVRIENRIPTAQRVLPQPDLVRLATQNLRKHRVKRPHPHR